MSNIGPHLKRTGGLNPTGGRHGRACRAGHRVNGFALVEIVVVTLLLAILAVLVMPRLVEATDTRRQTQLREQIQILRTAVTVYRAEHNNTPPGYPGGDATQTPTYETLVAQLTQYTDTQGVTSITPDSRFNLGPYFDKIPYNPINNRAGIRVIPNDGQIPDKPEGTDGWFYHPATGAVVVNARGDDPGGKSYFDY